MDTVKLSALMPAENKCPHCATPLPTGALAGLCPACMLKMGAAADTVTDAKQLPFVPPTVAELAPLFPQLEIFELIGKGGMGAVYKARQKQLDRFVALKILPPGIGHDAAFAERFTREAKALAKLNHPGIVTLFEFGSVDNAAASSPAPNTSRLFYFLMEFVDGVNLRQLLAGSRISAREALAIVPQICDALQFAHDQGIVHRDIKPENILMDRRGRVKVADIGLAKIVGDVGRAGSPLPTAGDVPSAVGAHGVTRPTNDLTDACKVMGTPQYMSPEQIHAPGEVDHRADIYALGVVFYQMLTGELPGKQLQPPSSKVQIDVRLDEIVLRALEKKPELRYQQVSAMKTQMETIAETPNEKVENGNLKAGTNAASQSLRTLAPTKTWPQIIWVAFRAAAMVWLAVFATTAAVTSLLPRSYEATATVDVPMGLTATFWPPDDGARRFLETQLQLIKSESVLKPAWEELTRREHNSLRAPNHQAELKSFQDLNARIVATGRFELMMVSITARSYDAQSAADIANTVAEKYCGLLSDPKIIDRAAPSYSRVRPNVEVNLMVGAMNGALLALLAGGVTALWLATRKPVSVGSCGRESAPTESERAVEDLRRQTSAVTKSGTRFWRRFAIFVVILTSLFCFSKVLWLASAERTAESQQQIRGALQIELADKIARLLVDERRATYSRITFEHVPQQPDQAVVSFGKLQGWRDENGTPQHQSRNLNGNIVLNFQPPNLWTVTGTGDLNGVNASWQTATPGFSTWSDSSAATKTTTAQRFSFGPVVERVLTNYSALDLSSGQMKVLPDDFAQMKRWDGNGLSVDKKEFAIGGYLGTVEVDIAYVADEGIYGLIRNLNVLQRNQWESFSSEQLAIALRVPDGSRPGPVRFAGATPQDELTNYTYGFMTSVGQLGLLQITGYTENPRGVKLRYKLVQNAGEENSGHR